MACALNLRKNTPRSKRKEKNRPKRPLVMIRLSLRRRLWLKMPKKKLMMLLQKCLTCSSATNRIFPLRNLAEVTRLGLFKCQVFLLFFLTVQVFLVTWCQVFKQWQVQKLKDKLTAMKKLAKRKASWIDGDKEWFVLLNKWKWDSRWRQPSNSSWTPGRRMTWWTTMPKAWWMIGKMKSTLPSFLFFETVFEFQPATTDLPNHRLQENFASRRGAFQHMCVGTCLWQQESIRGC